MSDNHIKRNPRYLLATDLDGTLVGSKPGQTVFKELFLRHKHLFHLAYVTGRNFRSAWGLIAEEKLLHPDILITDVGTEIYLAPDYILHPEWDKKMSVNWNRQKISARIEKITTLKPQNIDSPYRLAYFTEEKDYQEAIHELNQIIRGTNLGVEIVPSMGHIIDIIPAQGGKGPALRYMQHLLKIERDRTIVCGDSGNDLSMFAGGAKGIVVGNAKEELKEKLHGFPSVYFSALDHAFGILEGLKEYGVI
ncbi:HAD-IIB family hydrolase [Candidatus Formimonas warabiya]|uniref:HAD-IIB family hydrolase n=1 Tax=Formimonas warabiya TaxID=1761012 RepID=UPI001F192742|nr:HAD-IIB family hydrolase [Candidatus Formimonas warabiya]